MKYHNFLPVIGSSVSRTGFPLRAHWSVFVPTGFSFQSLSWVQGAWTLLLCYLAQQDNMVEWSAHAELDCVWVLAALGCGSEIDSYLIKPLYS